jgi:hypothetical protein
VCVDKTKGIVESLGRKVNVKDFQQHFQFPRRYVPVVLPVEALDLVEELQQG